jgi:hypothetical protein
LATSSNKAAVKIRCARNASINTSDQAWVFCGNLTFQLNLTRFGLSELLCLKMQPISLLRVTTPSWINIGVTYLAIAVLVTKN